MIYFAHPRASYRTVEANAIRRWLVTQFAYNFVFDPAWLCWEAVEEAYGVLGAYKFAVGTCDRVVALEVEPGWISEGVSIELDLALRAEKLVHVVRCLTYPDYYHLIPVVGVSVVAGGDPRGRWATVEFVNRKEESKWT